MSPRFRGGVTWDRGRSRWRARLWVYPRLVYLGCFVSWDAAMQAWLAAKGQRGAA